MRDTGHPGEPRRPVLGDEILTIEHRSVAAGDAEWRVVSVRGEIDMTTAPRLRDQLTQIVHRHSPHLIVDLSGITFCDSSGLTAFLGIARRAALLHGELRLAAPTDQMRKILHITGIDRWYPVRPTVQAALHPSPG